MSKIMMVFVLIISAFVLGYFTGSAQTKVKISEKKAEVINNVAKKRAVIQAEPNASRAELLELMRSGEL
jgi:uncharacterized membrane protein